MLNLWSFKPYVKVLTFGVTLGIDTKYTYVLHQHMSK
jgi:hypothetical protein